MDAVSIGVLLAWAALALAALTFTAIGGRAADIAAWAAFAAAMGLTGLPRWVRGDSDREAIGPFRLWLAACSVALLFCLASTFVVAPRVAELRAQAAPRGAATAKRLVRAEGLSVQFLCVRIALAVGLALGARRLPRVAPPEGSKAGG